MRRYGPTELCDGAQMVNVWRFFASCISSEPHAAHFIPAFTMTAACVRCMFGKHFSSRFSSFVCASNISGTAERIWAKFTGRTCLVTRSDEFECQGQRSNVEVIRDKNVLFTPITLPQRRNGTRSLQYGVTQLVKQQYVLHMSP